MADAVDVKEYYEKNADKERDYVRVYSAIPMKDGDNWIANVGGLNIQQSADEDGFKIKAYTGLQDCREQFLGTDEFNAKAVDAAALHPSQKPEEVTAEDEKSITPIKKGKQFVAGGLFAARAECDGFLVKDSKGKDAFISNYALTSAFNYAGQKMQTDGAKIVSFKDEPQLKGIILDEDQTFAFKSGPYEAKAGSFITPNPDDEDGFTAYPPGYATFGLRRNETDEDIAKLSDVKLESGIAVKGPLHLKRNP